MPSVEQPPEGQPVPPLGENPSIQQQYDQAALLGSLGLEDLRDAEAALRQLPHSGQWHEILRNVRGNIEASLAALYQEAHEVALPDAPPYDPEQGPRQYLAAVRQENVHSPAVSASDMGVFRNRYWSDVNACQALVIRYAQQHAMFLPGYSQSTEKNMTDLFLANMRGLVMPPRIRAEDAYVVRRQQFLRTALPDVAFITPAYFRDTSRNANLTSGQVGRVRHYLAKVPHTMEVPDFFQMEAAQQQEVVQELGRQWQELCQILYAADPQLIEQQQWRSSRPLAFWDIGVLQQALRDLPISMAPRICRAFLRNPRKFDDEVTTLAAEDTYTIELARSHTIDPGRALTEGLEPASEEALTENMAAIRELLGHPLVNPDILNLMPGTEMALSKLNKPLPIKEFDEFIALHLQLLGRALGEAHPVKNPRGLVLDNWERRAVGPLLRAKFAGTLRNIHIARLPVTEENLQELFGEDYDTTRIQPASVARLVLSAELKSTGKPAAVAAVDLLLTSRKYTDKPDAVTKRVKVLKSTGAAITRSFQQESAAIARLVEAYNLNAPLNVGLPGTRREH